MNNAKKIVCSVFGILSIVILSSCNNGGSSPSGPETPSGPTIIIEKDSPNAVAPPCGSAEAVCGSITDGLISASQLQDDGIPTVLLKAGNYDAEANYPIHIRFPVRLKSEEDEQASIAFEKDGILLEVNASNVTLEGIVLNQGGIRLGENSGLTIRRSRIFWSQAILSGAPVVNTSYEDGVSVNIEDCDLYGSIVADTLTITNTKIAGNVLQPYYQGESSLIKNCEIDGFIQLAGGPGELRENQIIASGQAVQLYSTAKARLYDNTITSGNSALFVRDDEGEAFISGNRFNTTTSGATAIECLYSGTVTTDGTNRLLNPNVWLKCNGLPSAPGSNSF